MLQWLNGDDTELENSGYISSEPVVIVSKDLKRDKFSDKYVRILKEKFSHLKNDDIARYLIANNNNLRGAEAQLERAEAWKKSGHWHVLKDDCLREVNKGKCYAIGHDREGRPMLTVHAKMHDPNDRDLKEMVLMTLWWTEQAIAQLPPDKSKFTFFLVRDGCESVPYDTEYMQYLSGVFQDLHPERLHRAIIYPTGTVFYHMWNIFLKWFLAESTREKVVPALTLADVQEYIDSEFIPARLGGNNDYKFDTNSFQDPVYSDVDGSVSHNYEAPESYDKHKYDGYRPSISSSQQLPVLQAAGAAKEVDRTISDVTVGARGSNNNTNTSINSSMSTNSSTSTSSSIAAGSPRHQHHQQHHHHPRMQELKGESGNSKKPQFRSNSVGTVATSATASTSSSSTRTQLLYGEGGRTANGAASTLSAGGEKNNQHHQDEEEEKQEGVQEVLAFIEANKVPGIENRLPGNAESEQEATGREGVIYCCESEEGGQAEGEVAEDCDDDEDDVGNDTWMEVSSQSDNSGSEGEGEGEEEGISELAGISNASTTAWNNYERTVEAGLQPAAGEIKQWDYDGNHGNTRNNNNNNNNNSNNTSHRTVFEDGDDAWFSLYSIGDIRDYPLQSQGGSTFTPSTSTSTNRRSNMHYYTSSHSSECSRYHTNTPQRHAAKIYSATADLHLEKSRKSRNQDKPPHFYLRRDDDHHDDKDDSFDAEEDAKKKKKFIAIRANNNNKEQSQSIFPSMSSGISSLTQLSVFNSVGAAIFGNNATTAGPMACQPHFHASPGSTATSCLREVPLGDTSPAPETSAGAGPGRGPGTTVFDESTTTTTTSHTTAVLAGDSDSPSIWEPSSSSSSSSMNGILDEPSISAGDDDDVVTHKAVDTSASSSSSSTTFSDTDAGVFVVVVVVLLWLLHVYANSTTLLLVFSSTTAASPDVLLLALLWLALLLALLPNLGVHVL